MNGFLSKLLDKRRKFPDLPGSCLRQSGNTGSFPRCVEKRHSGINSIGTDFVDRGLTDSSLGYIYDPHGGQIIDSVVDCLKIGQYILDFPPGVKINPAHKLIGNIQEQAFLFKKARLSVRPVQYRKILIISLAAADHSSDLDNNVISLIVSGRKSAETNSFSRPVFCPELF